MARVLVVDDSRTERFYLLGLLRDAGHDVIGMARNGEEAIALCEELKPDVMLIDVAMRGMHGDVAARKIRDAGTCSRIIIVSSNVGFLEKQYKDEGFTCVSKPHSGPKILTAIEGVIRGEPLARPSGTSG